MQYQRNEDLSVEERKIIGLKNDNTYIIHSVSTDSCSSGSPIILSTGNLKIIGILQAKLKDKYKKGVYFKNILEV